MTHKTTRKAGSSMQCKQPGCSGATRGYGWCNECRAKWRRGELATVKPERPANVVDLVTQRPPTRPRPAASPLTEHGYRCQSCARCFPVLVDGVLCIGCDGVQYPSRPAGPVAASSGMSEAS